MYVPPPPPKYNDSRHFQWLGTYTYSQVGVDLIAYLVLTNFTPYWKIENFRFSRPLVVRRFEKRGLVVRRFEKRAPGNHGLYNIRCNNLLRNTLLRGVRSSALTLHEWHKIWMK